MQDQEILRNNLLSHLWEKLSIKPLQHSRISDKDVKSEVYFCNKCNSMMLVSIEYSDKEISDIPENGFYFIGEDCNFTVTKTIIEN